MGAKQHERADRIRAAQREFFAMLTPQRFRHENITVKPVRQTKSSRDPERQARADVPKRPANSRAENKAETESHADHAKCAGTFFFRNDVSDISHRRWNTGSSDSLNNPAEK